MSKYDPDQHGEIEVTYVVNGKTVTKPLSEALADMQKAEAAERKFDEANALKRSVEAKLDEYETLQKALESKDGPTLVKGLQLLSKGTLSQEEAEVIVYGPQSDDDSSQDDDSPRGGGGKSDSTVNPEKIAEQVMNLLSNSPQFKKLEVISKAYDASRVRSEKGQQRFQTEKELDSDPVLGKILKDATPEKKSEILGIVHSSVEAQEGSFTQFGPRQIQAGITNAKKRLENLGILTDDPGTTPGLGEAETVAGIGIDAGAQGLLGVEVKNPDDLEFGSDEMNAEIAQSILRNTQKS